MTQEQSGSMTFNQNNDACQVIELHLETDTHQLSLQELHRIQVLTIAPFARVGATLTKEVASSQDATATEDGDLACA